MSVHLFQQWITDIYRNIHMYRLCIHNIQKCTDRKTGSRTDIELDKGLRRQIFALLIR